MNIVRIFAVPRGARVTQEGTVTTIDGEVLTELPSVEPYAGTPALTDQGAELSLAAAPPNPLPGLELGADNVTKLNTFKCNRED